MLPRQVSATLVMDSRPIGTRCAAKEYAGTISGNELLSPRTNDFLNVRVDIDIGLTVRENIKVLLS